MIELTIIKEDGNIINHRITEIEYSIIDYIYKNNTGVLISDVATKAKATAEEMNRLIEKFKKWGIIDENNELLTIKRGVRHRIIKITEHM